MRATITTDVQPSPVPLTDDEWFRGVYPALRRYAAVVAPGDADPDDLVQDALANLLRRQRVAEIADRPAYLYRAISNLAKNGYRRSTRAKRAFVRGRERFDPGAQSYPSDLADLLRLPPRERGALYLRIIDGRDYEEVGELLGCSEPAARKAVSRGRERLGQQLAEEDQ